MIFDDPILYFKGLTIFRDFSDKKTYYFLPPEMPRIARSAEGGETGDYAMRLVLFRPDPNAPPPQGMENGGGFLNLDTDLHVNEGLLDEVRDEIRSKFGADANLVPVPFLSGSVELVLLGVNRDDEGKPFVRKIAGSTVPSLYGTQRAAFSVVLDHHGAALMKQVIEEGGATMALAIYHLTYAAIPPAYNLKITVDYERVFEHLDLRLNASVSVGNSNSKFVGKAGFHMLIEELKESRAIKVEEVDPIPGENGRTAANQEMINEIIGNLMGSKWFKPTLSQVAQMADLGSTSSGSSSSSSGSSGSSGSSSSGSSGSSSSGSSSSSGASGASGASGSGSSGSSGSSGGSGGGSGSSASGASSSTGRQAAVWTETFRSPGFPSDRGASHTPAPNGNEETIVIRGAGATAKVGTSPTSLANKPLDGNNLKIDLPAGQTRHVEITWPAPQPGQPTPPPQQGEDDYFHLFFDFDQPENASEVAAYSTGTPPPPGDNRFLNHSRARSTQTDATPRGPAALEAWLRTLAPDVPLELNAYASNEQDPSDAQHNRQLSQRRLEVATALIRQRSGGQTFNTSNSHALGHDPAAANAVPELDSDTEGRTPDPQPQRHGSKPSHRVVVIKGRKRAETPPPPPPGTPSVLRGNIRRPGPPPPPPPPSERRSDPTKVEASFEVNLEMIERTERITAIYELSSSKARTREVHPQGQLILDAIDPSKYVLEADGAIDFFQWIELKASTTAQWETDGINSINIDVRYGPMGDGRFKTHRSLQLTPTQETATATKMGVLHENDDSSRPVVYWYEYRVTINYLQDVAMGDQQGAVTSVGAPDADAQGWIRSTSRNLVIHPRDVTPVVTVNVATGIMHYDLLERAQLALHYGPYRQNLALSAQTPTHRLIIRPEEGLENQMLRSEGMLFYRDGAQVPLPSQEWSPQELIVINEPRENILRVRVMLADPNHEYQRVVVQLRYEHQNRVVEKTIELTGHAQMEEWAVRLESPDHRAWSYRATLIKTSGDIDTIEPTETEETQVVFGIKAKDVIPVNVTWLIPPSGDLLAVKIDMLYVDDFNDVRWEHSELIRSGHPGNFSWSIPIKDESLRSYRYRVTEFRQTGPKEGPWLESDTKTLVLMPLP